MIDSVGFLVVLITIHVQVAEAFCGLGGFEQLFWSQTIVPTVSEIVSAFVPGVSFPARERSAVQAFTGDCLFSR